MPIDYFNKKSKPMWSNKSVGSSHSNNSFVRLRKAQKIANTKTKIAMSKRANVQFGSSYKQPKRKHRGFNIFKFIIRFLPQILSLLILGIIIIVAMFAWYSKDLPDPNKIIERNVSQSTKIYDREGKTLLYDVHGAQQRTLIEIKDLPPYVTQATIAIEDKDFYKHSGFSIWAIFRSAVKDVLTGQKAGGSTLTQQFVKNALLTNEKSISRKIKELIISYRIEQKYSKDEILKMYFNEIPYGSVAYGIESAANVYFGKSAKDLTLAEAASLAAMTQAPSYYSPFGPHKDALIARQQYVLKLMLKQGYINEDQYNNALKEKLNFKLSKNNILAPHFVFYVKDELSQLLGDNIVENGGLKVITTLDAEKQQVAEDTITKQTANYQSEYNASNAALLSIDIKTGDIISMVGSRDFFSDDIDGQVNVTLSSRQPGSSIKPMIYELAFERGYQPETVVFDVPTIFKTDLEDYIPQNYNLKTNGPVTLRKALAGSLNIPAVKVLYLVGIQNALDHLTKLGYTTIKEAKDYGLSLVLGGLEVKIMDHVNSFATLARGGVLKPTRAILRVEDANGKVLYEAKDTPEKNVMDENAVKKIDSILSDNNARSFIFGEKNYLTLGVPVAVKTGTTNDFNDAWTIGYTPNIVTGVWIGNNDNTKMKNSADGSRVAAPIWQAFMKEAIKNYPSNGFDNYEVQSTDKPMLNGQIYNVTTQKIDSTTGLPATENTPIENILERQYKTVHCILHYINKEDPLGPIPEHPEFDPNYSSWESSVQQWAVENGINTNIPISETKPAIPETGNTSTSTQ